ncbi:MAG TPA: DUF4124 domain-containing protein [Burkholderiales bacterium]|nr:DUF4124 domain-containing protein [Burkholderiales bacterium]
MRSKFMCRIPLLAALTSAVTLCGLAQGQVYKWVDDKGVVNYSSSPPPKSKGVVTLNENNGRVTTVPAPDARRDDPAATSDPALRRRVDQLEREAAAQRQGAAQQDAAGAEAYRRWVEQCRAERRVDCDDPSRGALDPGYSYAYPPYARPPAASTRPAPSMFRPTPDIVQGGGGAVGPYYRPPPGGIATGSGSYGIGGGYVQAPPGGVVVAPGPGGVGAQYVPVPESSAPQPRLTPRPRPMPLQQ